jgi:hypothetical protein
MAMTFESEMLVAVTTRKSSRVEDLEVGCAYLAALAETAHSREVQLGTAAPDRLHLEHGVHMGILHDCRSLAGLRRQKASMRMDFADHGRHEADASARPSLTAQGLYIANTYDLALG